LQKDVQSYLAVLACALTPSLLFRIYGTFNQSLGKPLMVTWLQVAALTLKIPLSIWFVAGGAGLEPMGVVGCAWATLIVNYALVILAVIMLRTQSLYQPFQLWRALERPDWPQIGRFLRLGLPGGLAYLVEVTSFTLMALFIARLGTTASAGHQIAASIATVLYMVPLSLAIASGARVSFWIGSGHPTQAKTVVFMTLRLAALVSVALSAIIFIASHQLAGWYSTNPRIIESASSLLVWVALYHVADSTQAVSAFLLRCYRITLAPLAIYGVLLWGLGLWGGYQLTYHGVGALQATQQALSFWVASAVAIMLVALALVSLLLRAVYRSQRPAVT
jgi:MATE family multidrug resistance protein